MYKFAVFVLLFLLSGQVFAQTTTILSPKETLELQSEIPDIPFSIRRAYAYSDKRGSFDLVLCEKESRIRENDTLKSNLTAICYLQDHGGYREQWRITDALAGIQDQEYGTEYTIWFWTKYCSATDIDGDGIVEPIIVYGTKTEYGYKRIKIITLYKGHKYAIRAVECDLDFCRTFVKDAKMKELPLKIRQYIDQLLEQMRKEQDLILHHH
ncbi:hypothetical protein DBR32_09090 [Taibaiella sp. KBW10]|nr:hypothetical protein DBR32_09090 [Taibaiella sp. KBW10]